MSIPFGYFTKTKQECISNVKNSFIVRPEYLSGIHNRAKRADILQERPSLRCRISVIIMSVADVFHL